MAPAALPVSSVLVLSDVATLVVSVELVRGAVVSIAELDIVASVVGVKEFAALVLTPEDDVVLEADVVICDLCVVSVAVSIAEVLSTISNGSIIATPSKKNLCSNARSRVAGRFFRALATNLFSSDAPMALSILKKQKHLTHSYSQSKKIITYQQ
jgi:hypothetical protein